MNIYHEREAIYDCIVMFMGNKRLYVLSLCRACYKMLSIHKTMWKLSKLPCLMTCAQENTGFIILETLVNVIGGPKIKSEKEKNRHFYIEH